MSEGARKLRVSAKQETDPSMSDPTRVFQHRDSISEVAAGVPSVAYEIPPLKTTHRDSISEGTAGVPSVAYEIPPLKTTVFQHRDSISEGTAGVPSVAAPAEQPRAAAPSGARVKGLLGGERRGGPRRGPPPVIDMGPPGKPSSIIRAEGAPDLDGSSNTFFILELMRQQKEKLMRKKKDEMINEMALKMKRDREEAKRKGATTYSYSYGGFLGVEKLTRGSANVAQPSPKPSRSNPKAIVIDEVAAVPSDAKSRAMFEGP